MAGARAWTLSQWTDAGHVLGAIDQDNEPGEAAGVEPEAWYAKLRDAGNREDAIMFIAHAMPRYECVVWGARAMLEMGVASRDDPPFVSVLRWIDDPSDATRRAAEEIVNPLKPDDPRRALGMAAFFSGGSIAPDGMPPVQPDPHICSRFVGGALLFAARRASDREKALDMALAMGEDMIGNAKS